MQGKVKGELLVGKTFPSFPLGPANFYTLGEEGKRLTKSKGAHSTVPVAHGWSVML